jgi:hypothetical protein
MSRTKRGNRKNPQNIENFEISFSIASRTGRQKNHLSLQNI